MVNDERPKISENKCIFDENLRESVHIQPDPVNTHQNTLFPSDSDVEIIDFRQF